LVRAHRAAYAPSSVSIKFSTPSNHIQETVGDVEPIWAAEMPRHRRPREVDIVESLLMLLMYMSDGSNLRAVAQQFGRPIATVWRAICVARDSVARLLPQKVRFPTGEELRCCAQKIYDYAGLKEIVALVDGTHIPYRARIFMKKYSANRKGYVSLILHAFVDAWMRLVDVHIGALGLQHDARVLRHADVVQQQLTLPPEERPIPPGCVVLGDDAYPLTPWLTKKYEVEDNADKVLLGKRIARARGISERTYGVTKTQFPILEKGRLGYAATCKFTGAAVVLHNYTVEDSAFYDFDDYAADEGLRANEGWKLETAIREGFVSHELATRECYQAGDAVRARIMAELVELREFGNLPE